ncbi:hypothetical protein D9M68_819780 [compost metagenome]
MRKGYGYIGAQVILRLTGRNGQYTILYRNLFIRIADTCKVNDIISEIGKHKSKAVLLDDAVVQCELLVADLFPEIGSDLLQAHNTIVFVGLKYGFTAATIADDNQLR